MDTPQAPAPGETDMQRDIRENKDIAAFGYVWIMSIAVYASHRNSKFAQYHSKQGIVLFIASIPVVLIPFFGKYLLLILVAGMLLGFVNAAQGAYRDVPIAGPLSRGEMSIGDLIKLLVGYAKSFINLFTSAVKSDTPPSPPPSASSSDPAPASTQTTLAPMPPIAAPPASPEVVSPTQTPLPPSIDKPQ